MDTAYNNRKPRAQWKDRYIYTILGLTGGALGLHNFYLGRKKSAVLQLLTAAALAAVLALGAVRSAVCLFSGLLLWITGELFCVSREPDGDRMNDEARPLRLLLIGVYGVVFILLPLLFLCYLKI